LRKSSVVLSIISAALSLSFAVSPASAATKSTSKEIKTSQVKTSTTSSVVELQTDQTYTASDLDINVVAPPANFNPLKASDAELAEYNFPERPTDPQSLADWEDAMGDYKQFVKPNFKLKKQQTQQIPQALTSYDNYFTNWSGWIKQYDGNTYKAVSGNWTVPNVATNTEPNNDYAYSSTWVGLGGVGNGTQLMQAGTEQDYHYTTSNYDSSYSNYYMWWEVLPASQTEVSSPAIKPGDAIYVSVSYTSGSFHWYLEDKTTGKTTSGSKAYSTSYYDGSTAEWIVERTQLADGSLPDLAHFGTESFTSDQAETSGGTWKYLSNSDWTIAMQTDSGLELAYPDTSVGTGGAFKDHWKNW
jgi:hypothetical protein